MWDVAVGKVKIFGFDWFGQVPFFVQIECKFEGSSARCAPHKATKLCAVGYSTWWTIPGKAPIQKLAILFSFAIRLPTKFGHSPPYWCKIQKNDVIFSESIAIRHEDWSLKTLGSTGEVAWETLKTYYFRVWPLTSDLDLHWKIFDLWPWTYFIWSELSEQFGAWNTKISSHLRPRD